MEMRSRVPWPRWRRRRVAAETLEPETLESPGPEGPGPESPGPESPGPESPGPESPGLGTPVPGPEFEPEPEAELLDGPLHRRSSHDPRPLVAQPVIAMRTRPHLAMISGGLVFAIVGAVCVVLSSVTMLRLTDTSPILPAVGNLGAVLNALIALMQWRLWRLALKEWEGIKDVDIHGWLTISANGTWLAVVGAGGVAASSWVMLDVSARSETSWWLAMGGAIFVILGTALAGVHRFRPDGPRGVPAQIRRNHDQHALNRQVPTVRPVPAASDGPATSPIPATSEVPTAPESP